LDLFREQAAAATGRLDKAGKFLKTRVFGWGFHYLKSRFGGRHEFRTYPSAGGDNGVYPLRAARPAVKVSVAGDWATGTEESFLVGELISAGRPDFTIHLGDVYYVGTNKEVAENMLGGQVAWPRGSRRSFALNGNHEMYARGKAYFVDLLPQLHQHASYFALRNDHWLLVGLDTGYNSVGIPFLEKLFKPSCRLPDTLVQWLRDGLQIDRDTQRGIVIMSHHQYYSAFEDGYEKPARQLQDLITRPVLWLWGHEHRFALYGKAHTRGSRLEAYGRCLGHGGMTVEGIRDKDQPKPAQAEEARLVLYDRRRKRTVSESRKGTAIGYNGYAELVFDGAALTIDYVDIDGDVIVQEKWTVSDGGALHGEAITRPRQAENLGIVAYKELGSAIT
jgi:hypothetical protein